MIVSRAVAAGLLAVSFAPMGRAEEGKPPAIAALGADHDEAGFSLRSFATAANPLHLDGVSDDAPVIQAAIDHACSLPNGGTVRLPNGRFAIASTLLQPCPNVRLEGEGTGGVIYNVGQNVSNSQASTYLNWVGGAGGTILRVAPRPATSWPDAHQHLSNVDVTGIAFNCLNARNRANSAAVGLDIRSARGSRIRMSEIECTYHGLHMDTVPLGDTNDIQHNEVWIEGNNISLGGTGVYCGGTATTFPAATVNGLTTKAEERGNCSDNIFTHVYIATGTGDGMQFGYADHNGASGHIDCIKAGPGACVRFMGSRTIPGEVAYANHFGFVAGGAVLAEGCAVDVGAWSQPVTWEGTTHPANRGLPACVDAGGHQVVSHPESPAIVGPAILNYIDQLDTADGGTFSATGHGATYAFRTDQGDYANNYPWPAYVPALSATGGAGVSFPPAALRAAYHQDGGELVLSISGTVAFDTAPQRIDIPFPKGIAAAAGPQACAAADVTTGAALYAAANNTASVAVLWSAPGNRLSASGDLFAVNCTIHVR